MEELDRLIRELVDIQLDIRIVQNDLSKSLPFSAEYNMLNLELISLKEARKLAIKMIEGRVDDNAVSRVYERPYSR